MRIITIVGARPQFIKAAPVSRALAEMGHSEIILHTGQHYDDRMSQVFFQELELPIPAFNLKVGSGSHGWQTAAMLSGIEEVLIKEKPDWVLVYGDTNSTLAGALAASKLRLPLAHVEAGLRSFNREMPEEHNRVLTDHCSDLLFCPTHTAVRNLAQEGITRGVERVGDTMYDAVLRYIPLARQRSAILEKLNLESKKYLLTTIHRPYNTDSPEVLKQLLMTLARLDEPVVFPVHPRTRRMLIEIARTHLSVLGAPNLCLIDPVGYLDMLALEMNARVILTDSGGIQKEAYMVGVPCVTLRPETEWVETVDAGWNTIAGTDPKRICAGILKNTRHLPRRQIFGSGDAAYRIVAHLTARTGSICPVPLNQVRELEFA